MDGKQNEKPEVVIPAGYRLDEVMDFDDSDFGEEIPIVVEEVKLRFGRSDGK